MKLEHLKRIRVVVSLVVFVLVSFVYLDLGNVVSPHVVSLVVALQFIPSLAKSLTYIGLSSIGLFVVLAVTLLYGRVYCSTVCPLGTLQDLLIALNRRWNRRQKRRPIRFSYTRPKVALHYTLLGVTAASALGGSMVMLNLVEPFSNYGRIIASLIRPIVVGANNGIAALLDLIHLYALYPIPFHTIALSVIIVPVIFLGTIAYMALKHGRLFCNTLCPAGALLGIISRFSIFRLAIDHQACQECGLCEKVCKAGCIDADNQTIEFSACVGCYDCIESCPTVGIVFEPSFRRRRPRPATGFSKRRRDVLRSSAVAVAGLAGTLSDSLTVGGATKSVVPRKLPPITPPGSGSTARFTNYCTACHLCVSVCPTQILTPALIEYGIQGILQPRLDYAGGSCTYDCNLCTQICPSGAILPLSIAEKKEVQLGKAKFVRDDCIVITKKTDCGACSEHCPTKAVHMVPYEKLLLPEVNEEICVGCGACEHPCPVKPNKAIYVEANPVHLRAKQPPKQKPEVEIKGAPDFPF